MPWVRGGDTAASHPIALAVLEHGDCDDRLVNEAFGFVMRCAMLSTAHSMDYVVTHGTAVDTAGSVDRAKQLINVALFAGYFTAIDVDGRRAYKIIEDDKFIHLRKTDEVQWEQQQKRDRSDPALAIPVRLRDGDACRYCRRIVQWGSNRAARGGTYDHLRAGEAASVDTYVVACLGCNSALGDLDYQAKKERLLPPPREPWFTKSTVDWLTGHPWVQDHRVEVPRPSGKKLKAGDFMPAPKETSGGVQPSKADGPLGPTDNRSDMAPASAAVNDSSGPMGLPGVQPGDDPAEHESAEHGPTGPAAPPEFVNPAPVISGGPSGRSDGDAAADPACESAGSGPLGPSDSQSDSDPAEQNADETTPNCEPEKGVSPAEMHDRAEIGQICPILPDRQGTETGRAGTGRDGSGRAGSGRDDAQHSCAPEPARAIRSDHSPSKRRRRR